MDNSLYDLVTKVISATSKEDAEKILFGKEGYRFDAEAYYKSVVAKFLKKKETIISKNAKGENLFDISNVNDLWNIVFFGEILRKKNKKKEIIERDCEEKNIVLNEDKERINIVYNLLRNKVLKLDEEYQNAEEESEKDRIKTSKKKCDYAKKKFGKMLEKIDKKIKSNTFDGVETIDLSKIKLKITDSTNSISSNDIPEIVKDIKYYIKSRNSFGHSAHLPAGKIKITDDILDADIDIEYLEGVNNGRIIVKNDKDDRECFNNTNRLVSPVLEKFGYDLSKIQSFFYNIEPFFLQDILEYLDYDYENLYKLPVELFEYQENTTIILKYLRERNVKVDLSKICSAAFILPDSFMKLLDQVHDIKDIYKYGYGYYWYPTNYIKLLKYINDNNLSVDINKLYDNAFIDCDITINYINKLNEMGLINCVYDLVKYTSFSSPVSIQVLQILKNNNILYKLPELPKYFFYDDVVGTNVNGENIYAGSFLLSEIIRLYGVDCIRREFLVKSQYGYYEKDSFGIRGAIKFAKENGYIDFEQIPYLFFRSRDFKKKQELADYLENSGIERNLFSEDIYVTPEESLELLKIIQQRGFDLNNLKKMIYNVDNMSYNYVSYDMLYAIFKLQNKFSNDFILEIRYLYHYENLLKLSDFFEQKGFDKSILKYFVHYGIYQNINGEFSEECLQQLEQDIIKLEKLKLDYKSLSVYFWRYFPDNLNMVEKLGEYNIAVYSIPDRLYEIPINEIKFDNIKEIMSSLPNINLNELPIEFFTCHKKVFEEMLTAYNSNVAKSIFGIDNPKIIATILYVNSVMRLYQRQCADADKIDLDYYDIKKFVLSGKYTGEYEYKNNLIIDKNINYNFFDFVDQFSLNDDPLSVKRSKEFILDKLRNSSVHMRMRPVIDYKGQVVDNLIYLYDKPDAATYANFNCIIPIYYLVNFVREIEEEICQKYTNDNTNDNTTGRSR